MEQELLYAHDPNTTDAERIQSITASKYCPADLTKIVEECTHLDNTEQRQLLKLQQKFEDLFEGTLGTWKTDPVDLELIDPKVKPFSCQTIPIAILSREKTERANKLILLVWSTQKKNNSEWACPMFTIAKPDGSLRSFADLREVNKVIIRKPYPYQK
jgi:hypothetical protein